MSPIRHDVFMKRIFKGYCPCWICFNFCLIPNEEFGPKKSKELRPTKGTVIYNCSQGTQKQLRGYPGV